MRTCPYCGQEAMTASQKASTGPMLSVKCKSCGRQVSTHPAGFAALVPFLVGIGIGYYLHWSALGIAAGIVGAIAMFLIYDYAVPLVRRDG